jgi:hypothetical protein
MCFSFNSGENRAAFLADEEAYCAKYGLTDEQCAAVKARNVLAMIEAGGNVYVVRRVATRQPSAAFDLLASMRRTPLRRDGRTGDPLP